MRSRSKKRKAVKARPTKQARKTATKPTPLERRVLDLLARGLVQAPGLLAEEKRRRGVAPDQVVFVGTRNVAEFYWCAMQAVLKSRAEEVVFFQSHLQDRVEAALRLGRSLPTDPRTPADLLTVGKDINWTEVPAGRRPRGGVVFGGPVTLDEVAAAMSEDRAPSHPLARGSWAEWRYGERHPTVRWSFEWGPYVVVGVPDGLGKDFVYEFKSTGNEFLLPYQRPVARAQADLYGFFFGKRRKRIDIRVESEGRTERIREDVDVAKAQDVLRKFAQLDAGGDAHRPKPWKCKACEFRNPCAWFREMAKLPDSK